MGFKVGLALGGGASRGLAHFGVIKALVNAGIPIDVITGTSIGSIIASLYAADPKITRIIHEVDNYLNSSDFNQTKLDFIRSGDKETSGYLDQLKKIIKVGFFFAASIRRSSFISEDTIRDNLTRILPELSIEQCEIPLGLVSMDLITGKEINFTKGSLIDGVLSSCAIPGVFPPVKLDNKMLVDGSWVNPIPVDLARNLGADFVIAIDVSPNLDVFDKEYNGWNINLRANECTRIAIKNHCLKEADFILSLNVGDIHWADFLQLEKCILEGEQVVIAKIKEIKKQIFWHRLKYPFIWS
ncbi:MAG: hypothetical protein GY786_16420 [Proteobacteria bacterium]|nr:hypothetical protein [Pseudomonadota bacterium]